MKKIFIITAISLFSVLALFSCKAKEELYTVKYNVTEVNDGYILFEVYDSETDETNTVMCRTSDGAVFRDDKGKKIDRDRMTQYVNDHKGSEMTVSINKDGECVGISAKND